MAPLDEAIKEKAAISSTRTQLRIIHGEPEAVVRRFFLSVLSVRSARQGHAERHEEPSPHPGGWGVSGGAPATALLPRFRRFEAPFRPQRRMPVREHIRGASPASQSGDGRV